jgi:hypothetical protein
MTASTAKSAPCLGFLTIVEHAELGLLGGYLILNAAGRPLEFHCTAPVKPNRAQEILYGPTLKPFLYGEQIGQTLLNKSKLTPWVVCTDSEPVLAARDFTHVPMALVLGGTAGSHGATAGSMGATAGLSSSAAGIHSSQFPLAKSRVATAPHYASDQQAILGAWPSQSDHLDLLEPFTRIREALDEAQKSARQAA